MTDEITVCFYNHFSYDIGQKKRWRKRAMFYLKCGRYFKRQLETSQAAGMNCQRFIRN